MKKGFRFLSLFLVLIIFSGCTNRIEKPDFDTVKTSISDSTSTYNLEIPEDWHCVGEDYDQYFYICHSSITSINDIYDNPDFSKIIIVSTVVLYEDIYSGLFNNKFEEYEQQQKEYDELTGSTTTNFKYTFFKGENDVKICEVRNSQETEEGEIINNAVYYLEGSLFFVTSVDETAEGLSCSVADIAKYIANTLIISK